MTTSNWLFKHLPILFPRKKKAIRSKLEQLLQERFIIVTNRLQVEGVPKPRLKLTHSEVSSYRNNTIYFSYSKVFESDEKQAIILDHELAHHIQHSKNHYIKNFYPLEPFSFFYWSWTGKMRWGLRVRSFEEGFAVYVAYLTNGKLTEKTKNRVIIVQKGNRWTSLIRIRLDLPYALGYLGYSNIAKMKSEEESLKLGLSVDPKNWVA